MIIASVILSFITFQIFFWILAALLYAVGVIKAPTNKISCDHPVVKKLKSVGWADKPPAAKYSPKVNEFFDDEQTNAYAVKIRNEARHIAASYGNITDNPYEDAILADHIDPNA